VRAVEPLRALLRTLQSDVRELTEQRLAFGGGIAGTLLAACVLWGVAAVAHADDEPTPSEDFTLDFQPGTLARLGTDPDAADATGDMQTPSPSPEPPTLDPPAPPAPEPETVTEDHTAAPARPEPPPTRRDPDPPRARTDDPPRRDPQTPSHSGGKLPGPPSDDDGGNIWGDPRGWDDLTREGDAWASSVVAALRGLEVGWIYGKPAPGDFQFRISVCKDGEIVSVKKMGGTMEADGQSRVRLALEQLKLDPIPKKVADRMPAKCARIDHTFVWSSDRVK
jgi:hypothetical protein